MPQFNDKKVYRFARPSRLLGAASLVLLLGSPVAWAFGPPAFADFDADGDGAITEQEFNEFRAQRIGARASEGRPMRNIGQGPAFSDFDTDGNGSISPEEFDKMRGSRMKGRGMGPQGQAGAAVPEMAGGKQQQCDMPAFKDMDADKDGYISEEEMYRFRGLRMSERSAQGYPMRNVGNAPLFEDLDADGDKRLSPDEFKQAQMSHSH